MLLAHRRTRETLSETPRRTSTSTDRLIDETWFLRDLLDAYSDTAGAGPADSTDDQVPRNDAAAAPDQEQQRRREVLAFLRRRNRIPDHSPLDDSLQVRCVHGDDSLQRSRARMSSQELFLAVVLEWQRSATDGAHAQPRLRAAGSDDRLTWDEPPPHSHRTFFQPDTYSYESDASSSSSSSSSDSELEEIGARHHCKRQRQVAGVEEVSPTSVHNVPRELTPLNLDFVSASSPKRIGVYTPRSRQELLRKYMAKRAKRLSQNKVRYRVRKTLANARPRVKGRFVKTEQPLTAALAESMSG